jgi:hypothetical protein
MESLGKTAALIFLSASLCSANFMEIGGSVSYNSLLGGFGESFNGGASLAVVCGARMSPAEEISILARFGKFRGGDNERLSLTVKNLSARFLLSLIEGRPYFAQYSVGVMDLERSIGSHIEHARYPVVGFGGGLAIPLSDRLELLLSIGFSRVLESARSGDILSFDAEFSYHP